MPEDISPERIVTMAAAARVPLRPDSSPRIARSVTPTVQCFAAENLSLPMEVEPATFTLVQRREMAK